MEHRKRNLGGDIETNGLLRDDGKIKRMTTVHCIGYVDLDDGEEFYFGPPVPYDHPMWDVKSGPEYEAERLLLANPTGTVEDGVRFGSAENCQRSIFHNGCGFDYMALEDFYPGVYTRPAEAWDTIIAAKMVWPTDVLLGPDLDRIKKGKLPARLLKSHSLEAWGYRLGENKDEYDGDRTKYPVHIVDGRDVNRDERYARRWEEWNPWMASYMMQDNRPMVKLWKLIEKRVGWVEGVKADLVWPVSVFHTEHDIANIIARQELEGIRFDVDAARKLEVELENLKGSLSKKLEDTFGEWWHPSAVVTPASKRAMQRNDLPNVTIKRYGKTGKELAPYVGPPLERYAPDAPYTPIERVVFKASSRDHLGMRLQDVFGWKPKKFGKNGKPTVDESTLEEIPEAVLPPEIRKLILDSFTVNKTLGTVAKGQNAWLNLVTEQGRIHGRMDTLGTITGRGSHSKPNLGQVISVTKKKVTLEDGAKAEVVVFGLEGGFGAEARSLFLADEGDELTGVDMSSLELILMGHYLFPHDGGKFSARVCDPTRDAHQEHADIADVTRADAKTTIYLIIYGGTAYKLSLDPAIIVTPEEVPALLGYRGLPMILKALEKRFTPEFVQGLDDMQKARIAKSRIIIVKLSEGIDGLKEVTEAVKAAAEKGWLKGLDGRKIHVRKAYSAFNAVLQSGGAQVCKLWIVRFKERMEELGYVWRKDFKFRLWVHDEMQISHKPGLGPVIKEQAELAARDVATMLNLRGMLRTDGKTGKSWFDTH